MTTTKSVRCAIYTRKSSEEGLEQAFNSLEAQREACEAYVNSQCHEGWTALPTMYDDGGFTGGNMDRPALKRLLDDIAAKRIDTVVVYKVDRLTRSLADFAKIVEQFDKHGVSFVSVTQQFNTTSSMGRLTLNILLSFAQFEREVTGERIRDKIAASKRKGMWMGGVVPMGYRVEDRQLIVEHEDAKLVRQIFEAYLEQGCVSKLQVHLDAEGVRSKHVSARPDERPAERHSPAARSMTCSRTGSIWVRFSTRMRSMPVDINPSSARICGSGSKRSSRAISKASGRLHVRTAGHSWKAGSSMATAISSHPRTPSRKVAVTTIKPSRPARSCPVASRHVSPHSRSRFWWSPRSKYSSNRLRNCKSY